MSALDFNRMLFLSMKLAMVPLQVPAPMEAPLFQNATMWEGISLLVRTIPTGRVIALALRMPQRTPL